MPGLRQAKPHDWGLVRALLLSAGLPVDDLGAGKLGGFLIAENDAGVIGFIGLEVFGTAGLLRSLVVEKSIRNSGLGGKLIEALESAAEAAGIVELWLLTIDAERYFQRHNFELIDRSLAPDEIRQTSEFSTLCPDTAYLMRKVLR